MGDGLNPSPLSEPFMPLPVLLYTLKHVIARQSSSTSAFRLLLLLRGNGPFIEQCNNFINFLRIDDSFAPPVLQYLSRQLTEKMSVYAQCVRNASRLKYLFCADKVRKTLSTCWHNAIYNLRYITSKIVDI